MNKQAQTPTADNTTALPKFKAQTTKSILNDLNTLRDAVYKDAVEHGLWKDEPSNNHFLMKTMREISEALDANDDNKHANLDEFKNRIDFYNYKNYSLEKRYGLLFKRYIKDTVEDELADVVLMLLSFSGYRDVDLANHEKYYAYSLDNYKRLQPQTFEEFCFDLCRLITLGHIIEPIFIIMAHCEYNNIDLAWHIEQKMKYNTTREYLHGKKN